MLDGMSFEHAAALPVAVLTAWNALFVHGGLSSGQTVLIHAAAGGVGHIAAQLAKQAAARVAGTASGRNQAFLRDIGVDIPINYAAERFEEIMHNVDVILDSVPTPVLTSPHRTRNHAHGRRSKKAVYLFLSRESQMPQKKYYVDME